MTATQPPPRHPAVAAYLAALEANGRASTANTYGHYFRMFERWLAANGIDLMRATTSELAGFQLWLAADRIAYSGEPRSRTTQATAVIVVKSLYAWLLRRSHIVHDPAKDLIIPSRPKNRTVRKDLLTLQEATALIQTQAGLIDEHKEGGQYRALEVRNLALICLAIATGRRVHGLVAVRVDEIDLDRNELRVDREKSRTGRVLPVAPWAMMTVQKYLVEARPVILKGKSSPWLFVGQNSTVLCTRAVAFVLDEAVKATIKRNPDLTELPMKRVTTHSLRVSFASLLFQGGCNIRSINELMLHQTLTTTARYTPIALADLRRVLVNAHPRA